MEYVWIRVEGCPNMPKETEREKERRERESVRVRVRVRELAIEYFCLIQEHTKSTQKDKSLQLHPFTAQAEFASTT